MERHAWVSQAVSPVEAVAHLPRHGRVFIHGAAATPTPLLSAFAARRDVGGLSLYHLHTEGEFPFVRPECEGRFRSVSFFTGPMLRKPIEEGNADFMPVFLSDIPGLFRNRRIPLDAAIVQLSPPDKHGFCSLGTSVDAARAAVDCAGVVVAEINEQMPRTLGNSLFPMERVTAFTHTDRPLPEHVPEPRTPVTTRIGELVAELIEDGSCLQLGIGAIPDAVLARRRDKRDLGIHSEMLSDGVIDLVQSGAVSNRCKKVHPGRIVTSFITGTRRLFDFVDDNPLVEFHPCDRTNDVNLIAKNDKVVAINSALQVDLTGQVCADSIGHRIYSGIGGQMDFMRGAALSNGGKPILAFPSTACGGKVSRIVPELSPGAGVVTTRGHVHWVVTEYGAVNLHGLTLRERGEALIAISHPDFRPELRKQLRAVRQYVMADKAESR